jgi:nucleoid DNA-binding protein
MTKQQLIEAVAAKTSHGKTEVKSVLDAVAGHDRRKTSRQ